MFAAEVKKFIQKNKYPDFQLKAVFFDMDGVLLDSMDHHAKAWVKTMNGLSIPFTIEEAYMNEGRVGHDTINGAYLSTFGRVATIEEQESIYKIKTANLEALGYIKAMPCSHELLTKVKKQGLTIYLVTGSGQPTLFNRLDDYFPEIFSRKRMRTSANGKKRSKNIQQKKNDNSL